jgi:hypothetical protein
MEQLKSMARKRRWKTLHKRFIQELNGTSGLAGFGGALLAFISFIGLNALSSPIAAFVGSLGILITTVAIGMAVYKAIPPILKNPSDYVAKRLPLDELAEMDPSPLRLSVVGPPRVGKSTLVSRVRQQLPPNQRTNGVHAYIVSLQTAPPHHFAILDGPGQMFADQIQIGASADILCIILDHNDSDTEQDVDSVRIDEHIWFHEQIRGYFRNQNRRLAWVHLLLNKRDLWENSSPQDLQILTEFLKRQEREWRQSNLAENVTSEKYSNNFPNDGVLLLNQVREFLEEHNVHR